MAEELDFHLLELAGAEGEIPRRDLIAEALADLGDAEGNAHAGAVQHVLEVDEDALGRFRAKEDLAVFVAHRAGDSISNIRLNSRGSVRSPPQSGQRDLKAGLIHLLRGQRTAIARQSPRLTRITRDTFCEPGECDFRVSHEGQPGGYLPAFGLRPFHQRGAVYGEKFCGWTELQGCAKRNNPSDSLASRRHGRQHEFLTRGNLTMKSWNRS